MNKTANLKLALYEGTDKFNITSNEDSLNHNMELIDAAVKAKMDKFGEVEIDSESSYTTINSSTNRLDISAGDANTIFIKDYSIGLTTYDDNMGMVQLSLENNNLHLYSEYADNNAITITGVATPSDNYHAANKGYVDGKIGDIETALDELIAIQEALIGGDIV